MNIGIFVHSETGTTLGLSRVIAGKLREKGHTVDIVELKSAGPVKPRASDVSLAGVPDCTPYEALLVGGPVWAFSASPVAIAGIKALGDISEKKVLPFVTMGFSFPFMGGKQAVSLMSRTAAGAGATVLPGTIVPKLFRNRKLLMDRAAAAIASLFP